MSVEQKLCEMSGYNHAVLFSRARVAIEYYRRTIMPRRAFLPSNICPALYNAFDNPILLPVDSLNGLAQPTDGVAVHLYGFRVEGKRELDIDPALTCLASDPESMTTIVSFGYSKPIDLGCGAALLTNSDGVAQDVRRYANWDGTGLAEQLDLFGANMVARRARAELWNEALDGYGFAPSAEQIIPWRYIRRFPGPRLRGVIVERLRQQGFDAGTNYPPLAGCTDPSSVMWGNEVLNLWLDCDGTVIWKAADLIKRICDGQ